jgi:predicted NBD/HSP70 family sugar kinase
MSVYVGLDIGGTKFMVAAADESGQIVSRTRRATPDDLEQGLASLNEMIAEVTGGDLILGMGAAVGGSLDWERGIVSPIHQPTWRNVPLKALMEARWNCPFYVDVDTNVAALGEFYFGKASARSFLYLTLSTGMGGGMLIDGKVLRSVDGVHPEAGHQSIPYRCAHPERIWCECGVSNCLEGLVSGNGIRRIYGHPAEQLTPEEWSEVAYNLGQGLRNLAILLVPQEICLGGGVVVGGGEPFLQQARAVMQDHLRVVPAPLVRLSRLGYDTALLGAIAVAIHGL